MSGLLKKYTNPLETNKTTVNDYNLKIDQSNLFNTISQLNETVESIGIIDSITIINNILFCVAYRKDHTRENVDVEKEYYNCKFPMYMHMYSIWELMFPIKNIDLTLDIVDPTSFIGKYVKVKEINGLVVEMEYISELTALNLSPISITRTVLNNIRGLLSVQSLSDDNDYADKVYRGFGINKAVLKDLYSEEYSIEKTSGQVLVLKGDAQMTQETSTPPDNVRAINVPRVDVPNKNSGQTEQKSKKCHFPAIVFSARS